eukprot:scaffold30111_cov43-Cyclotella_meneghiniana.AAC.4
MGIHLLLLLLLLAANVTYLTHLSPDAVLQERRKIRKLQTAADQKLEQKSDRLENIGMHGGWTSNFGPVVMKNHQIVGSFSPITETTKQSDDLRSRSIGNEIGVLDLWDYSRQNGRKIHGLDMSRKYDERCTYYDTWAEEIMKLRGSNKNAMLLNHFNNLILQALTTLVKSNGGKKCFERNDLDDLDDVKTNFLAVQMGFAELTPQQVIVRSDKASVMMSKIGKDGAAALIKKYGYNAEGKSIHHKKATVANIDKYGYDADGKSTHHKKASIIAHKNKSLNLKGREKALK